MTPKKRMPWSHTPELAGTLWMYHFPDEPVRIEWEDGSFAQWQSAFWCKEYEFTVVYTEHCMYHVLLLSEDDKVIGQEGPRTLSKDEQREYDRWHEREAQKAEKRARAQASESS